MGLHPTFAIVSRVRATLLVLIVSFLLPSCGVFGPAEDSIYLETEPAGAKVVLRMGAQRRVLPGRTPMTIHLQRTLPDPLIVEFVREGYVTSSVELWMQRGRGPRILPRDQWKWPTKPIRIELLESPER